MQTDERSQHSEELSVDKDTLRPRARAPSPWHSTLVPRHERNATNPRKGVSRARPSNGDPSTRHCGGISRLALISRKSVFRSLQRVSSLQAGPFKAGNSEYIAVLRVSQVLLPLLLLITSTLGQISLPSSLWLRRPLPLM